MDKLEKVKKGLECCYASFPKCKACPVCQYDKICYHDKACNELLKDALELLKEQQQKIDGLLEDLATAIDDKDSALLTLNECDTVEHALSVLRKHGWKETDDVPYPVELLKEQKNLMLALDQSNSANEYLNEEVDKLNALLRKQQDEIAGLTKKTKSPTWRRGKAFCGSCGGCLENKEKHSADIVSSIRFCKWCGTPVDWSNE